MPDLGILSPSVAEAILSMGGALIVAAVVGGGLEAFGNTIPVISGWKRQVITGAFGLLLVVVGWEALLAANWRASYMDLVAGMSAVPPFPPGTVEDRLNTLANDAGNDESRNCLIADFIFDHNVELPISIKQRLVDAQSGNAPALKCYLQIEQQAANQLTPTSSSSTTSSTVAVVPTVAPTAQPAAETAPPSAPPEAASTPAPAITAGPASATPPAQPHAVHHAVSLGARPPPAVAVNAAPSGGATPSPAERILAALTQTGAKGWLYLGLNASAGTLGASRSVQQAQPRVGATLTTTVASHLRDPAATGDLSKARVVGVVPKGAQVVVQQLSGTTGPYTWALVQIARE